MAPDNEGDQPHLTADDELPPPEPVNPNKLTSTCHCGRVSVEMPSPPSFVNECHCTICYRYGALWAYYPQDKVNILVNIPAPASTSEGTSKTQEGGKAPSQTGQGRSDSGLQSYVRDDEDGGFLGFFFCGHCGCATHWAGTEKGLEAMRKEPGKHYKEGPSVGVNCRMLSPRLLEGVERRVSRVGHF